MHFIDNGRGTHPYKDGDTKQEGEHVCLPQRSTCIITGGDFPVKEENTGTVVMIAKTEKKGKRKTEEQPLTLFSTVKGATFAFIARRAVSSVGTPEGQTRRSGPIPRSWKKRFASEKSDSLASFLGTYLKAQVSEFVLTTAPCRVFLLLFPLIIIFR